MPMPRRLSALSLILSGAFLLGASALGSGRESAARPVVTPACNDLPDKSDLLSPHDFAQALITKLVAPSSSTLPQTPAWMGWDDKCVIFQTCPPTTDAAAKSLSAIGAPASHKPSTLRFEVPVQLRAPSGSHETAPTELSSVYYNCLAASSMKKIIHAENSDRAAPVELPAGSVIVKLIWDIKGTLTADHPKALYDSTLTPEDELNWIPPQDLQLSAPPGSPQDWTAYNYCPVSGCGGAAGQNTVSRNSLYVVDFPPKQVTVTNGFVDKICEDVDCTATLMGVNMMARTHTGGDWIWITLWWKGKDQNNHLPPPWNNYTFEAIDTDRTHPRTHSPSGMNILFNPYLEGLNPNGRVSNCRTCHSYAGLAQDPGNQQELRNTGIKLGAPDPNVIPADPAGFLKPLKAVPTDMVWSLSREPDPPAPAPAHPNPAGSARPR